MKKQAEFYVYRVSKSYSDIEERIAIGETKDFYIFKSFNGTRREKKESFYDISFTDITAAKVYGEFRLKEKIGRAKENLTEMQKQLDKLLYDGENYVKKSQNERL